MEQELEKTGKSYVVMSIGQDDYEALLDDPQSPEDKADRELVASLSEDEWRFAAVLVSDNLFDSSRYYEALRSALEDIKDLRATTDGKDIMAQDAEG